MVRIPVVGLPISVFRTRNDRSLLNEILFTTLPQAPVALAEWRNDYNTVRPHSKLGGRTPAEIATPMLQPRSLL